MAFSIPKNVPRFDDDTQRGYENTYWAFQPDGGGNGNAISNTIGSYFPNKDLPMYKDKPYSYAASRRQVSFWRRKRVLGSIFIVMAVLIYFSLPSKSDIGKTRDPSSSLWNWITKPGGSKIDWELRRESVKDAFKLSWDGYERNAWGECPSAADRPFLTIAFLGMDEYYPISKAGRQMTPTGMGWIIVDALDTLMIMNLTSRLSHARDWVSTSLNYTQNHDVNTFETTIRMLGGLLSAHYLSTEFPELAPLEDDDVGKPGEDLYIEKATDLADRILGAFSSKSGVPYASVNLETRKGIPSHADGGASSTAEAASLQLEFKYLAMLMGEHIFWEAAEKVIQVIDDNGMEDGLLPIYIHPDTGTFRGNNIRLGSRGDSYYGKVKSCYI